jgi:hypothetical protein
LNRILRQAHEVEITHTSYDSATVSYKKSDENNAPTQLYIDLTTQRNRSSYNSNTGYSSGSNSDLIGVVYEIACCCIQCCCEHCGYSTADKLDESELKKITDEYEKARELYKNLIPNTINGEGIGKSQSPLSSRPENPNNFI